MVHLVIRAVLKIGWTGLCVCETKSEGDDEAVFVYCTEKQFVFTRMVWFAIEPCIRNVTIVLINKKQDRITPMYVTVNYTVSLDCTYAYVFLVEPELF